MTSKNLSSLPLKLQKIQNKISTLRDEGKIYLQNGDDGKGDCPSNIALMKYWGKVENLLQIPENSSLSFCTPHFRSQTIVTVRGLTTDKISPVENPFQNSFELKDKDGKIIENKIPKKMDTWIKNILNPFAQEISLDIKTQNNFPTACGIASSASGYAALTMAIADVLQLKKHLSTKEFYEWCTEWARLGSGSATRSIPLDQGEKFVAWERSEEATRTAFISHHKKWEELKHCVVVLDNSPKNHSSSDGHKLAKTSLFHCIRQGNVESKYQKMKSAIQTFDFETVSNLTEEDAFSMHAIMQTTTPPLNYLTQNSALVISYFLSFRNFENLQAFWTADAGPNIHILFLASEKEKLEQFFQKMSSTLPIPFQVIGDLNYDRS